MQAACCVPLLLKIAGMHFWNRAIVFGGRQRQHSAAAVYACVFLGLLFCGVTDLSLPSLSVVFNVLRVIITPIQNALSKCYCSVIFNTSLQRSLPAKGSCGRICGNLELESSFQRERRQVNEKVCVLVTSVSSCCLTAFAFCGFGWRVLINLLGNVIVVLFLF